MTRMLPRHLPTGDGGPVWHRLERSHAATMRDGARGLATAASLLALAAPALRAQSPAERAAHLPRRSLDLLVGPQRLRLAEDAMATVALARVTPTIALGRRGWLLVGTLGYRRVGEFSITGREWPLPGYARRAAESLLFGVGPGYRHAIGGRTTIASSAALVIERRRVFVTDFTGPAPASDARYGYRTTDAMLQLDATVRRAVLGSVAIVAGAGTHTWFGFERANPYATVGVAIGR